MEARMPEVFDIYNIVPEFLCLAAKGTNDYAKKQVAYSGIINDYCQLTPFSLSERIDEPETHL